MSAKDLASALEAIIGVNDDPSTVSQFLSTGYPELDYALASRWDGGAAVGRIMEIAGPASSGKTAIATAIMADAQKQGGIAGFMDHERSFSTILAPKLGLDCSPGKFVFRKPRTFEESLDLAVLACKTVRQKKLIPKTSPIAWCFDSLASMVPYSALYDNKTGEEKGAEGRSMHDNTALARATSAALPAFAQHCEELDICAIFLNQVRTNLSVTYGDKRTTPGGESLKFYASQRIMLSAEKIKKDKETLGSTVTAQIVKNKVARPFLSASWRFEFQPDGTGKFAYYRSVLDFLDRQKLLEKSGNYIVWKGSKHFAGPLAEKLEAEGAWPELVALLPKKFEPEVVAPEGAE